jgi:hypothetical protein
VLYFLKVSGLASKLGLEIRLTENVADKKDVGLLRFKVRVTTMRFLVLAEASDDSWNSEKP